MPAACLLVAALYPALPQAQAPSGCVVGGTVSSGRTLVPGVVVSISNGENHALDVSASAADGTYALKIPGAGRYTLKAEFAAFAAIAITTIDPVSCQQRVDLAMTLASRALQPAAGGRAANARRSRQTTTSPAAVRQRRPRVVRRKVDVDRVAVNKAVPSSSRVSRCWPTMRAWRDPMTRRAVWRTAHRRFSCRQAFRPTHPPNR